MASLPGDHQFQSSLRSPARDAYDSRSCAITRGSVPNDMVAFGSQHGSAGPGLVQQRFATIQYPGTKELLVPRDGVTPGWNEEFINLIAQHKRSHILREEPPTLQHFIQAAPSIDLRLLQHMHSTAVKEWQQENTDVFYILRNSVNLAGPHNKTDLAMIEQKFCFNDLRDGKGFLEFVTGFKPEGSVRIQASYLRALDTKLSASATLTQVQVHCDALLCTWQKIRGNSIDHPEAFYHYLLESFPLEPESGKIPRLRGWIAEQITEESPTLVQPTVFLAKVALHGQLLRIPDSGESVHITTNGDRRQNGRQQQTTHNAFQFVNDCDSCDAKCCSSRKKGGKKFCVCKNAQVPLPDDASHGMKQFVSLNRAYTLLHPTADLTKTSVEQMRAAVRKSKKEKEKGAPAVFPVGLQAGEVPNLSGDQMQLFRQWLAESTQQVTMVAESDYLPDPVHTSGFLSLLALCTHCGVQHTPQSPWCPLSLGMPERCPSPGPGGCGRSHCERTCSCDMRGWVKEMNHRLGARMDLYNGQVELQLTLVHTAAHELVTLCIANALQAFVDEPGTRSHTAGRLHTTELQDEELVLQDNVPTWPIGQMVAELTHAARSQSPDTEVLVDALPHGEQVIALQSQLVSPPQPMQYAFQSRPAGTASPEEFVCLPPAITDDHVVRMVRAEHHPLHVLMAPAPRRADRDQSHVLIAPVPRCAGFTFDPAAALRIPSVTEVAEQVVTEPECDDCDVAYTCEAHRGIYRCDDGVPGCNCSQPEVSIGGAIPIGGADATDDETTTDSEASGTRAGYCDTSACGNACKCSTRFKRLRPIVRAACDLLPVGTFRRPPLFKCGDQVQFAAPDRRIRLRTFGTITSVVYDGAVPQYVVATASTLSKQYTVLEDRLERAAAVDPHFALHDSELVLRGASAATTDLTDHPRVVLTLDVVDEDIAADDFEGAEEGIDETSVDDVTDELTPAQDTVMATFEARLLAHNAETEARLRAQYDALLAKQTDAHSRVLLAMEAQRIDFDKAVNTPAVATAPTAGAASAHINTRLSDPNAAAYVTPAPRDVPMQEIMSSPLQALRAGTLAMAETQRRASFARVFDLNSSGSTAAASPPEDVDIRSVPKSSHKESAKTDEASINEYYARAQLANAKLIRSYKTRIEALKQSTITYYINKAMLAGGKVIGFSMRRLSWAEIGFLTLLARTLLPAISPHLRPMQLAFARMIADRWLAWKRSAMATIRAAALTTVTGMAARLASADSTSVADAPAMADEPTMHAAWSSSVTGPTMPPPSPASATVPDTPGIGTSKVVMPVGNISAAVLPVGLSNHGTALCDDGATIDCFVTLDGVIPGTFDGSQGGPLTIGDKSASLASEGVYLYAIERCGADGSCQDELFSGHHTPNGVANILSESREVNVRQSRIEWCPGMARQIHTKYGDTLPLIMGSNGLGFLTIRAITDRARIVRLLQRSTLTPQWLLDQIRLGLVDRSLAPSVMTSSVAPRALPVMSTEPPITSALSHTVELPLTPLLIPPAHAEECLRLPVPVSLAAPALARQLGGAMAEGDATIIAAIASNDISFDSHVAAVTAAKMALAGVGLAGRLPTLTPFQILVRVHCILGHATLNTCLATIACATTLPKGFITREAIKEYLATKCGICESTKMRRRTFRLDISGVTDHTIPEIGKAYVFDTLGLRVPSAQWGYINITRFSDRNPNGIKRSYGHISMEAEAFEKLILTMRAFSRPYKGEILVMKKDGHPSHRSYRIQDLFVDSSMVNQESPPYVHEGVNTENTFQWTVPSAMATLAGSEDSEAHFYTAYLFCERAENRAIHLEGDGISAEQRFTGRSHDLLTTSLVYGSPCKFLQHPEVRDSKFDAHALPGRYRGPSRDDESDHRCWVQSGDGAVMRHITIDIGCMRIDERSALARFDRNHPSHQPLAIDLPSASPAPDFSRWLQPGMDSYESLELWTASTPVPTSPTLVLIGAGAKRDGDGPSCVKAFTGGAVSTIAIDHELGGYEHDWRLENVQKRLIQVVSAPAVIAVIYMLNCNPWSALHCLQPGPPVLFDADNLGGKRDAAGKLLPGVIEALSSVDPILSVLQAAFDAGKQLIGETPVVRGKGSIFAFKEAIYEKHVNAFTYPPLAALHAHMGSVSVYSDQSQVGAATQKTTEWMVTPGLLPSARLVLGTLRDASYKRNTPATSLIAGDTRDYSKSAAAAKYTPQQWERLVIVSLSLSPFSKGIQGMQPREVFTGVEQREALRSLAKEPLPASVQRPRREATDARYTVDGKLHVSTRTRASLDKARRLRGQVTCVDGALVALHVMQQQPPEPEECILEDMAVMVLQSRHQQSLVQRNLDSDSLRNLDSVIEAVDVRCVMLCVETGEVVSSSAIMALADGISVPVHLDTAFSRDWHKPVTYRDYLRSPQRGLWRTAMELRMDAYKAIPLYTLVSVDSVLSQGYTIINTLWAFSIKYTESGTFDKLNPRWCMMGGGMDRARHESYAEVCRWSSVLIIIHIACAYKVVTFSFDISNAFQSTDRSKAVEPGQPPPTRMFCYQAPGFAEQGPDGQKLCCELLMLMQGAIDASRLFGTAFGHTLLKRAGARRALWDREVWEYHKGPLAASAESLEKILAACSDQPPAPGAPPGWAVFSKHTDDGLGASDSQRTTDHLMNTIGIDWACKASNWKKHLGYGLGLSACGCFCRVDCIPVIEALYQRHMGAHNTYRPKHPYPMNIADLKPGVRPPLDSPERAPFDEMQAKCQSGLATSIWISRAHTGHVYPTNFLCGMMSNPSYEVYKCWQHSLMAERASPCPLVLGSGRKVSLSISADPPRPFSGVRHREMGFHVFVDADLGTPKSRTLDPNVVIPPISEGYDPTLATIAAKSVSGIRMYLGGIEFISSSLRQHLTSPDPHTSEIGAAGTAISMALPIDGLLRELHIHSETPIPIYCDSQSTIFASRSAAATKRSVWIERRTIVLREFVELRECTYHKIDGRYNVADGSTKPIPHATWLSHRSYSHPYFELSDAARSVVAAAFHVVPDNPGAQVLFDTAYAALTASDRSTVDRLFMLIEGG